MCLQKFRRIYTKKSRFSRFFHPPFFACELRTLFEQTLIVITSDVEFVEFKYVCVYVYVSRKSDGTSSIFNPGDVSFHI